MERATAIWRLWRLGLMPRNTLACRRAQAGRQTLLCLGSWPGRKLGAASRHGRCARPERPLPVPADAHAALGAGRCRPARHRGVLRRGRGQRRGAARRLAAAGAAQGAARPAHGAARRAGRAARRERRPESCQRGARQGPCRGADEGGAASRAVLAHRADRRRQDAGVADVRTRSRREARPGPRHLCHPVHQHHRADGARVPRRAGGRAGGPRASSTTAPFARTRP